MSELSPLPLSVKQFAFHPLQRSNYTFLLLLLTRKQELAPSCSPVGALGMILSTTVESRIIEQVMPPYPGRLM